MIDKKTIENYSELNYVGWLFYNAMAFHSKHEEFYNYYKWFDL
jgi:hypothetical protein